MSTLYNAIEIILNSLFTHTANCLQTFALKYIYFCNTLYAWHTSEDAKKCYSMPPSYDFWLPRDLCAFNARLVGRVVGCLAGCRVFVSENVVKRKKCESHFFAAKECRTHK